MPQNIFRTTVFTLLLFINVPSYGQKVSSQFIIFPGAMQSTWITSLGLTFTTTPPDITEETHISVPAFDVHFLKRTGDHFNLDAHAQIQMLQNHASIGFRWIHPLSDKFSIAAGDDFAGWMGWIQIETINTRGYGILNYPNLSIGYRFDKELLLTLKGELLLNFYQKFYAGDQEIEKTPEIYSGQAIVIVIEQPFFKDTWITLGFRAMYSNFFWQAWSLFENYDRNIFYPQLMAAFVL